MEAVLVLVSNKGCPFCHESERASERASAAGSRSEFGPSCVPFGSAKSKSTAEMPEFDFEGARSIFEPPKRGFRTVGAARRPLLWVAKVFPLRRKKTRLEL